jgi:hypothetical protein
MADIQIEDHGSIVLLRPTSPEASDWLDEHCAVESWQRFGDALAVDPRYVGHIIGGAREDGFSIESAA